MDAHMIDSAIFGHQWTTPEARAIFAEKTRVSRWVEVIIALARAQAAAGVIPKASAEAVATLRNVDLSIEDIAQRTRDTSHSTLGMIQVLREHLPESAAEHVYYGTTVQDISDTAHVLEMRDVGALIWRDLWQIEALLLALADQHRATPMAGRTHGQPGSPIAFGFKVATWADEVGRHLQRLREGRKRWLTAQLGGAVGTLAFFGEAAMPMRQAFARELGLAEPAISWINARDRMAEFANLAAMISATYARISNEVFTLQRKEIGELAEKTKSSTVGSITMPHKRNPESSEQIVGLSRLVRAQASVLTETMVQENERDARGWKVEWAAFPELCHFTLAASAMMRELLEGLEVNTVAMEANLGVNASSEHLLSEMSQRLGKHKAQATLQEAYLRSREEGHPVAHYLKDVATEAELAELSQIDLGASAAMIDAVRAAASARRAEESETWG